MNVAVSLERSRVAIDPPWTSPCGCRAFLGQITIRPPLWLAAGDTVSVNELPAARRHRVLYVLQEPGYTTAITGPGA